MKKFKFRNIITLVLAVVLVLSINAVPASAASSSITGTSTKNQTVYTGPSSSNYVSMGSIGAGEKVFIIGAERGWYHIIYGIGNNKQKSGYVPANTLTNVTGTPHEEDFWGGYCISNTSQRVYSCEDPSTAVDIGGISALEGVTRLYEFTAYGKNILFIEYSTSSGAKRGYVYNPNFTYPFNTCVGRMTMGCNVYYGPSEKSYYCRFDGCTFGKAGFVAEGEYVAILAKNGSDLFIEYNTSAGRKRGVVNSNYVYRYNTPVNFADVPFYGGASLMGCGTNVPVYSGPSSAYPVIGTISNEDVYLDLQNHYNGYRLVQYRVNGTNTIKTGYAYCPDF